MKTFAAFLCFLCVSFLAVAQDDYDYAPADRIALNIPDAASNSTADIAAYIKAHLKTDDQKVRAFYVWVISHIKYDKDSVHRVILDEDRGELVTFAMRRKRGVCENFAAIFNDLCRKSDLKSFVIEGYTKQSGSIDRTSHAWCTVLLNNKWMLYDPTWDAGLIDRFVEPVPTTYYQVEPSYLIQTHMPFDPIFQLIDFPITYKEFTTSHINANDKTYFNYVDSLKALERLAPLQGYAAAALRIKRNGPLNDMVDIKLKQIKMEIEIINQDKDSIMYNGAIADYNEAIKIFNNFLTWRNNQFKPDKTGDNLRAVFENLETYVASARARLKEVENSKATLTLNTGDVQAALDKLAKHAEEQQIFLKNYIANAKQN